jgi:hypothetical protein
MVALLILPSVVGPDMEEPVIAGYSKRELASILITAVIVAVLIFVQGGALVSALVGGIAALVIAAIAARSF